MKIIIIASVARNRVIGLNGNLPWNIPEDLSHFKATTMGHFILMGSKTYNSMDGPLPGRVNIVLSGNSNKFIAGRDKVVIYDNITEAIRYAKRNNAHKLFICGGGEVYRECIKFTDEMLLTELNFESEGDTYFPEINPDEWQMIDKGYIGGHKLIQYVRSSPGNLVS